MLNRLLVKLGSLAGTFALAAVAAANVSQTAACDFDLKIDDSCSYNGAKCVLDKIAKQYFWEGSRERCSCAWKMKDLNKELFFNLNDVKPGDIGENTVSLHITGQSAWVCAQVQNVKNFDNGCTDPEKNLEDASSCGDPGAGSGELQNYLKMTVWQDKDCDNVLDAGEKVLLDKVPFGVGMWPIADSKTMTDPLKAEKTYCIGIGWYLPAGTGNIMQTDSLLGDLKFTAVSAQGNKHYVCGNACVPKPEVCDGKDNDCDGKIDNGAKWSNLGKTCWVGQGKCKKPGTYVCDPQNPAGKTICSVKKEVYNRFDNNFNGCHSCSSGNYWK
jgi:hypothetical protein